MKLPRSLSPFRTPAYARFWFGGFVSHVGTAMETVAVGILVVDQTGKAGWSGIVAAAGLLPLGLMSVVGGALADRIPRRRMIITAISVQIVFAALLTILAVLDVTDPPVVSAIVFLGGIAAAATFPVYATLLPDLVPIEDLPAAVRLNSTQPNLGRIIGPAFAGLAIALGGYELAFALNTLSFFAVLAAVAPMRLPPPARRASESVRAAIANGLRLTRVDRGLRAALTYMMCAGLLASPMLALVPAMAAKVFHEPELGTWVIVTAFGLGAVTMAVGLGTVTDRLGLRLTALGGLRVIPLIVGVYALAPNLWWATVAAFLAGAAIISYQAGFFTVAQLRSPDAFRGRVLSVFQMVVFSMYSVGAIVQGWVADAIGLRATTLGAAALLIILLSAIRAFRPGFDHQLDAGGELPRSDAHTGLHERDVRDDNAARCLRSP
jgi:MFS family permease